MGPVVLWGGAAIWLYMQGVTGWAVFKVVWGAAVISSIDNFLKPLLIARVDLVACTDLSGRTEGARTFDSSA